MHHTRPRAPHSSFGRHDPRAPTYALVIRTSTASLKDPLIGFISSSFPILHGAMHAKRWQRARLAYIRCLASAVSWGGWRLSLSIPPCSNFSGPVSTKLHKAWLADLVTTEAKLWGPWHTRQTGDGGMRYETSSRRECETIPSPGNR